MKFVPATIILMSAFAAIYFFGAIYGSFHNLFFLWTMLPYLLLFALSTYRVLKKKAMGIIPIAGAIVCLAGLIPYWDAYALVGIDGQAALIFVVIPIYQAVGLFVFSAIGYITIKSIKDAP